MAEKTDDEKYLELIHAASDIQKELEAKGVWKKRYWYVINTTQYAVRMADKQQLDFLYRGYLELKDED